MWSWRNPLLHCCDFSRIQFQEATSRASDNFVVASHAELSGLRQGWRIITVEGKEVQCPQEAVEFCSKVRGRIWVEDTHPTQQIWQSTRRFQKHAGGLGSHSPPRAPAIFHARQERSAAADASAQGSLWGIGGWCSAETPSVTPGSCWWFQLEGSMADLPQSWDAGNEAQPLIGCFELLAQLALLVCRLRSPLPVSGRISLRQGSDNIIAGAAIMKGFMTSHPLRRFAQVIVR